MNTINVSKILSEEGLLTLKNQVKNWQSLEIFETETAKTWVNFGGFNGNPKDLWLRKKGTRGATSKTFIRATIATYENVSNELRWKNIQTSPLLAELVEKEKAEKQSKVDAGLSIIDGFNDPEKAAKYLAKRAEKNSHQYRTYLGNKCVNMGAMRNQAWDLEKRCKKIAG